MEFKTGIIAILGRPNSGKSTLLNALIGQKIAAVTEKPQTTRHTVRGIRHTETSQMVFLDTPGFHRPHKPINEWMVEQAKIALQDADITVLLVPVDTGWKEIDAQLLALMMAQQRPCFVAISKIDLASKSRILPLIETIRGLAPAVTTIPISALTRDGLTELTAAIEVCLPLGPPLYPPEQPTDQTMRVLAAEIIREKIFAMAREEIPYSVAVEIETYREARDPTETTHIGAVIYVERPSQKGIVIGKGGEFLKKIGTAARHELEAMIGGKVFLELFVKVAKDWTEDPRKRKELGYG